MIVNFGGNVRFEPASVVRPVRTQDIIDFLTGCPRPVRAIGALHSWSPLVETTGTVFDLSAFTSVEIVSTNPPRARLGAGGTISHVVERLAEQGYTLPAIGAIREQRIAGAISTGTHGSGNRSISSFVTALELVTLRGGEPRLERIDAGDELEAARCSLGALGIIVAVEIEIVPRYQVLESFVERSRLRDILAEYEEWPLQQFILLPWSWRWFSFRRRKARERSSPLKRHAWKAWNAIGVDFAAHALNNVGVAVQKAGSDRMVKALLRDVLPRYFVTGAEITDESDRILTMNHHWFRHLEAEVFVPDHALPEAVAMLEFITRTFGGEQPKAPHGVGEHLDRIGMRAEIEGMRGAYTHHYPFFFRKILADSTMIAMTSLRDDTEVWHSISLFSYMEPRDSFIEFAGVIGRALTSAFGARFHWGKFIPVHPESVVAQYPRLGEFERVVSRFDPDGVFRNDMVRRYLSVGGAEG